jgi:hypothetical protein
MNVALKRRQPPAPGLELEPYVLATWPDQQAVWPALALLDLDKQQIEAQGNPLAVALEAGL